MKRTSLYAALIAISLSPLAAHAQTTIVTDFNTILEPNNDPIPGRPPQIFFEFGGVSNGVNPFDPNGDGNLNDFPQALVSVDGDNDERAYEVVFDTSGVTPAINPETMEPDDFTFFFGGFGTFAGGFFGNGSRTGGAPGADNPANWQLSVDVRADGALNPNEVLRAQFVYFDPDFDEANGVDGDGNGQVNGADTYILDLTLSDTPDDGQFTTNTLTLDVGTGAAPRTEVDLGPESPFSLPIFNDDGNWALNFNFNNDLYGNAAGNAIAIDNIVFEFIPPPALPGDYNGDGSVDAADYTVWRDQLGQEVTLVNEGEGITPGLVTIEDYDFWVSQFGSTVPEGPAALSAVPEPASLIFAVIGLLACFRRRQR